MDLPLEVLIQQAVDMKTAHLAENRRFYDSHKAWYRNSLFARDEVKDIRNEENFIRKKEFVESCRLRGNEMFRNGNFVAAIIEYEQGLSIWNWVESTLVDWKHNAIEDKDLRQKSYLPKTNEEEQLIVDSKVSLLLNLALSYQKHGQYRDSIDACEEVLRFDSKNLKALYRKAQAKTLPKSSGITELLSAQQDLKQAIAIYSRLDPEAARLQRSNYEQILRSCRQLENDIFVMKRFEKQHFFNLFEKIKEHPEAETERSAVSGKIGEEAERDPRGRLPEIFRYSVAELETLVEEIECKLENYVRKEEDEGVIEEMQDKLRAVRQLLGFRRQELQQRSDLPSSNSQSGTERENEDQRHRNEQNGVEETLYKLYEKESRGFAEFTLKTFPRSSLRQMLLTRSRNHRLRREIAASPVITRRDDRFAFTESDVHSWSEEEVFQRIEKEMVLDFIETYRRVGETPREGPEDEVEERKAWTEAMMDTLQLYLKDSNQSFLEKTLSHVRELLSCLPFTLHLSQGDILRLVVGLGLVIAVFMITTSSFSHYLSATLQSIQKTEGTEAKGLFAQDGTM